MDRTWRAIFVRVSYGSPLSHSKQCPRQPRPYPRAFPGAFASWAIPPRPVIRLTGCSRAGRDRAGLLRSPGAFGGRVPLVRRLTLCTPAAGVVSPLPVGSCFRRLPPSAGIAPARLWELSARLRLTATGTTVNAELTVLAVNESQQQAVEHARV